MAAMTGDPVAEYWNSNVAHHPLVLDAVPAGCRSALDVGCGDGLLAMKLAERAPRVVGIDLDAGMVEQARRRVGGEDVELIRGDFLAAVRGGLLVPGSFDFVCSVTVIHHMDFDAALAAMARLVAPGGTLFVVGIARNRSVLDLLIGAAAFPLLLAIRRFHGGKSAPKGMPVKDATMTYAETEAATLRILPDAVWRRRLHVRYTIEWTAPR